MAEPFGAHTNHPASGDGTEADVIRLEDALPALGALDDRKCPVELRFFGGLRFDRRRDGVGAPVSSKTVLRDWEFARAWLQRDLSREAERDA
jgi:hypothetical protein